MLLVVSGIEVFFQMLCGLGIYIETYGTDISHKKWKKFILVIIIILEFLLATNNNSYYLIATVEVLIETVIEGIWLWLWTRTELSRTYVWVAFYKLTCLLMKMPILILGGIVYKTGLGETNANPVVWEMLLNFGIVFSIFIMSKRWRVIIVSFLRQMLHQRVILYVISTLEFIVVSYLMYLGVEQFSLNDFIMACTLIICLLLLVVLSITIMEYQLIHKSEQMIASKESSLRESYTVLSKEIEYNRKINHDRKHDLSYLYDCFQRRDYEEGIHYIEARNAYCETKKQNAVWTGHGGVDFLLNSAKQRAEELQARYCLDINLLELPMTEYDIFAVLGNLLDNAIEAIEQCDMNERYIKIKMMNQNNIFQIYIENSYKIEPIKQGKRFLTTKVEECNVHGWGIENVREIVERYDGLLDIRYENHNFSVDLALL